MKRIRFLLMGFAIFVSIGGAMATRQPNPCAYQQQYILAGGIYMPVFGFGTMYTCLNLPGTCTYYRPNPVLQPNLYLPCRQGYFMWIP